jgi:hypothetical protein
LGAGESSREFDELSQGGSAMFESELTVEQQAEAERIEDILKAKAMLEIKHVARLLASKSNRELLGQTEFQIRDAMHRLGAAGIDAALEERKKRGTEVRARPARIAGRTPASTSTGGVTSTR